MEGTEDRTRVPRIDAHADAPAEAVDDGDLEALYRRHGGDLLGLAYLLTGDADAARELAEEAFLRSVGRFQHRRAEERFAASLHRNLVTLFLAREHTDGSEPETAPAEDPLWAAVTTLPPRQRAAVVLRHGAGLSDFEVARAMRCSVHTARTRIEQAIAALGPAADGPS